MSEVQETVVRPTGRTIQPVDSIAPSGGQMTTPATDASVPKAAAGFAQMFGLHPTVALMALVLDAMLFGGEIASFGLLIALSIFAGGVFGCITFLIQREWYGDDKSGALIKALMMGLLTAIPTPLPASLYLPAGAVGLIKKLRGK
jgi:hypothetical protein